MRRDRTETNRRYYDKKFRRTHLGKFRALCGARGPLAAVATCKTCLMVKKARKVGTVLNEWDSKRIDAMFRQLRRERCAAWRKANPEKARAAVRRWRDRNRDVLRVMNREWYARNRERKKLYNQGYNVRRRAQEASRVSTS